MYGMTLKQAKTIEGAIADHEAAFWVSVLQFGVLHPNTPERAAERRRGLHLAVEAGINPHRMNQLVAAAHLILEEGITV